MNSDRRGWRQGLGMILLVASLAGSQPVKLGKQNAAVTEPAGELVRSSVANEVASAKDGSDKHMFRSRKESARGSQTRLYVQTNEAMAAMLIAYDDKPISAEQMQGEIGHLDYLSNDRDALRKKQKQEHEDADRTLGIVKALPDAFLYEYDGEEPSKPGMGKAGDTLVRLKFRPNPDYDPPSRVEQVLPGMQGFLLIDKGAHRIAKIDGQLFRDVTFGWGILGHLDKGGTFIVYQGDVGDGAWEITRMQLNMTGKILLFKSIVVKSDDVLSDFRRVASDLPFAKGAEMLKSEAAKMRSAGTENRK